MHVRVFDISQPGGPGKLVRLEWPATQSKSCELAGLTTRRAGKGKRMSCVWSSVWVKRNVYAYIYMYFYLYLVILYIYIHTHLYILESTDMFVSRSTLLHIQPSQPAIRWSQVVQSPLKINGTWAKLDSSILAWIEMIEHEIGPLYPLVI